MNVDPSAARSGPATSALREQRWVENRPTKGFRALDVRELWAYRELAAFLALRDLKVRYKQAIFGAGWALLQPLAAAAVFTLVFRRLARMPSDGVPYPLFAFVGVAVWGYFSGAVTKATQTLVQNVALVSKVYFPRILAPTAAVLPPLVDLGVSLSALVALIPLYGGQVGWSMLTLPLWVVPLVAAALGVGLLLGALNVTYRDVNHGVTLLVQLWLFASPVAYPSSAVPEDFRSLYFLNPVAGTIEGFRWVLVGAPWPGPRLFLSFATTALLLVAGVLYFLRTERRFADVI